MVSVFLFYPVFAKEIPEQTTAWDAGYIKAEVILPTTTASYGTIGSYGGSCVSFVKASLGVKTPWYNPRYVWDHADLLSLKPLPHPIPGAIIITSEGDIWHMGLVQTVEIGSEYGIIKIVESNFIHKGIISERTLTLDNPMIIGFLYLD